MEYFKEYEKNGTGRDYVVGDIHGCFTDLEHELERIGFDESRDRLFSVGDLADRGPESERALEWLKKPWFFPVLGNHEEMFLMCWYERSAPIDWHDRNGGGWVRYTSLEFRHEYADLISKLPLVIKIGNVLILHSLFPRVANLEELKAGIEKYREFILWERDPKYEFVSPYTVYAGHTIVQAPTWQGSVFDIDTGAFLKHWGRGQSGRLTIKEIIHADTGVKL